MICVSIPNLLYIGKKNFIVSGTAINIPNCANHNNHVPLYELPAIDKKDIGLNSVANIETDVTHHV